MALFSEMMEELGDKNARIAELEDEIKRLNAELRKLKTEAAAISEADAICYFLKQVEKK